MKEDKKIGCLFTHNEFNSFHECFQKFRTVMWGKDGERHDVEYIGEHIGENCDTTTDVALSALRGLEKNANEMREIIHHLIDKILKDSIGGKK